MSAPERYGRRKVSNMLKEWNALRDAVRFGDPAQTQAAFDACEEWVDFAFGHRTDTIPSDPRVKAMVEAAQWARNRLEIIADESWHGDGRDLKRSIIGIFADFDAALAAFKETTNGQ